MFQGPEYASYVDLMRALRLERPLTDGDYYYMPMLDAVRPCFGRVYALGTHDWVWLPRLDQWLAMLEEVGYPWVGFSNVDPIGPIPPGQWSAYGHAIPVQAAKAQGRPANAQIIAPTREEAAARLWLAVTGREAPRG